MKRGVRIPLLIKSIAVKNIIAKSVDIGGATTSVERKTIDGQETLVVTRQEDVTDALRQAALDRQEEIRVLGTGKGLGGFKVGEFPQTILMEMGRVHGVWYGMPPEQSGCADKKELYRKFCRVVEEYYPLFKSTNRKLI